MKKPTTPIPPSFSPAQLERIQKLEAKKREEHKAEEDELMAMTYGPNWRTQMPPWAHTYAPKTPVEPEAEVEPTVSEIRLGTRVLKREVEEEEPRQTRRERRNGSRKRR